MLLEQQPSDILYAVGWEDKSIIGFVVNVKSMTYAAACCTCVTLSSGAYRVKTSGVWLIKANFCLIVYSYETLDGNVTFFHLKDPMPSGELCVRFQHLAGIGMREQKPGEALTQLIEIWKDASPCTQSVATIWIKVKDNK